MKDAFEFYRSCELGKFENVREHLLRMRNEQCKNQKSENRIMSSKCLLDVQSNPFWCVYPPLVIASIRGHIRIVELLLHHGANVNVTDSQGKTSLAWAAEEGHLTIVMLLLDNGAKFHNENTTSPPPPFGRTPLHLAALRNRITVVEVLLHRQSRDTELEKGTESCNNKIINQVDNDGWTALHLACKMGNTDVVQLLLSSGADMFCKTGNDGTTPLYIAALHGRYDIVQVLLTNGAWMGGCMDGVSVR